jgi:hypothetical protein
MNAINEIFFDNHGLTSTSASHLADLAQEVIAGCEAKLKNLTFVTTKVDIVGSASESGKTVNIGYDEKMLEQVRPLLEEIASMNAFCAWMREAVKAKDKELKRVINLTFEEWCSDKKIEIPSRPEYPEKTKETDIIAQLNIKERNRYFQLEAVAATIGKYIHPGGAFSVAREELQNKMVKPYSTDGNGKDTLIYAHTPSVNPQRVEDVFFELQKWHRQNERELNKMKFAIKKQAEKNTLEDIQQFKQALEHEKQRHMQLFTQYKEWQLEERERISRLKIVVPEALQDTYERLNKLEE